MIKILVIAVIVLSGAVIALLATRTPALAPESTPTPTPVAEPADAPDETSKPTPTVQKPTITGSKLVLDLSNQGLTKTPDYVFERTEIQELNLSGNNLTGALQAEVRHLQNLRTLDLSNNQFTGLPAEIGQLKNLEILDVSNNQLTGLPYELGNLENLKVLNLSGNNYSTADLDTIQMKLPRSTVVITKQ